MTTSPKSRADLGSIEGLADAINALPTDTPGPEGTQGHKRYTTQRGHWLGWLGVTSGTGSYERKTPAGRGARYVYSHIVEPRVLLWLIEAAHVDPALVSRAEEGAKAAAKLAGKSKAIRQVVSYAVVADALWSYRVA